MGQFVIAAYKPKPGMEDALVKEVKAHVPTLRRLGLATKRSAYAMKSKNGTIVEVFEWKSQDAIDKAHQDPLVKEMWNRFSACCDYVPLASLPEVQEPFPPFEPIGVA